MAIGLLKGEKTTLNIAKRRKTAGNGQKLHEMCAK